MSPVYEAGLHPHRPLGLGVCSESGRPPKVPTPPVRHDFARPLTLHCVFHGLHLGGRQLERARDATHVGLERHQPRIASRNRGRDQPRTNVLLVLGRAYSQRRQIERECGHEPVDLGDLCVGLLLHRSRPWTTIPLCRRVKTEPGVLVVHHRDRRREFVPLPRGLTLAPLPDPSSVITLVHADQLSALLVRRARIVLEGCGQKHDEVDLVDRLVLHLDLRAEHSPDRATVVQIDRLLEHQDERIEWPRDLGPLRAFERGGLQHHPQVVRNGEHATRHRVPRVDPRAGHGHREFAAQPELVLARKKQVVLACTKQVAAILIAEFEQATFVSLADSRVPRLPVVA